MVVLHVLRTGGGGVLSVRGHMILAHAELRGDKYRTAGLIRQNLGCSEWQYAAELDALIDTQAAQEAYPQLCHRLQRLRAKRQAARRGCAPGTQNAAGRPLTRTG